MNEAYDQIDRSVSTPGVLFGVAGIIGNLIYKGGAKVVFILQFKNGMKILAITREKKLKEIQDYLTITKQQSSYKDRSIKKINKKGEILTPESSQTQNGKINKPKIVTESKNKENTKIVKHRLIPKVKSWKLDNASIKDISLKSSNSI